GLLCFVLIFAAAAMACYPTAMAVLIFATAMACYAAVFALFWAVHLMFAAAILHISGLRGRFVLVCFY
ncbi:unnamed protein product, partial [Ilex paraguariensis]